MTLLTLTTDFGTQDYYVAELKGVLLSEGPSSLRLVDLSHELAPFDIHAAALFLRAALPRFPAGSIHLAVVDPGVGSERRALIVERPDMLLVGPDNALFSYLFDGTESVYAIAKRRGMDLITVTDHDEISGALALGDRADVLTGCEVTAEWPDLDLCVPLNVLDITPSHHREIQRLRHDGRQLMPY